MTSLASVLVAAGCNTMGVGALPGSLDVSDSGAAMYTVPVRLPPGVGGAVPSLSLMYSSHAGDGLLGTGWSLVGLSSITRCPRTIAIDGEVRGIDFGANDAYCLDGERLISIGGGQYRTHTEQFAKIESFGTAGTGPAWFRVTTRNGVQHEYGYTEDSRIAGVGLTGTLQDSVRAYVVNKVIDRSDNYYTVEYDEDGAAGDFWPVAIEYSGHLTAQPKNRVEFVYQERSELDAATVKRFIGPAHVSNTKLLKTIRVQTDATLGWDTLVEYELRYASLSERGRSRLEQIQECVPDTINALIDTVCKPPTTFHWTLGTGGLDGIEGGSTDPEAYMEDLAQQDLNGLTPYPGDYDGDGITDLFMVGPNDLRFCSGRTLTAGGTCVSFDPGLWAGPAVWYDQFTFYPGDYTGDGQTDLLLVDKRQGVSREHWICYDALWGPGSPSCVQIANSWQADELIYTGDYDGDGRTDALRVETATGDVRFCAASILTDASNCVAVLNSTDWPTAADLYPGDYTGDGRTDIIAVRDTVTSFCDGKELVGPNANCQNLAGDTTAWKTNFDFHPGDYNGDGQEDFFLVGDYNTFFCAGPGVTKSNNCIETSPHVENWRNNYNFFIGDFDGNGATDITLLGDEGVDFCQGPYIGQSNGLEYCGRVINQQGMKHPNFGIIPGDFDGDGVPDFLVRAPVPSDCPTCHPSGCSLPMNPLPYADQASNGRPFNATATANVMFTVQNTTPDASGQCHYRGLIPSFVQHLQPGNVSTQITASCSVVKPSLGGHYLSYWCDPDDDGSSESSLWHRSEADIAGLHGTSWRYEFDALVSTSPSSWFADGWTCNWSYPKCTYTGAAPWVDLQFPGFDQTIVGPPDITTQISLARGRRGPIDVIDSIHVGIDRFGGGTDYQITYNPLTNTLDPLYTKGPFLTYPQRAVQQPMWVTRKITSPDGLAPAGSYDTYYSYEGLRSNAEAREQLGFAAMNTLDMRNNLLVRREFHQVPHLAGRVSRQAVYEYVGTWDTMLSETTTTWEILSSVACGQCKHPVVTQTVAKEFELGDPPVNTTTTTTDIPLASYDAYGNPELATVTTYNDVTSTVDYTRTTETSYSNNESAWVLGLPTMVTESATGPDGTTPTRTTTLDYDTQGRLLQTVAFVGSTTAQTTTSIDQRSDRGLVEETTVSVIDPDLAFPNSSPARTAIVRYDDHGLPDEFENELGHITKLDYDAWGQVTREEDPNGVVTTHGYDGFGRLSKTTHSNAAGGYVAYADCAGSDCAPFAEAFLQVTSFPEGSARVTTYYDALGREVGQRTHDAQLRTILILTTYDKLGRVIRQTRPYFDYEAPQETVTTYDLFDRVKTVTPPGQPTSEFCYLPLSVRYVGPNPGDGQRNSIRTFDAAGNLKSISRNHNQVTCTTLYTNSNTHVINYLYDGFGNTKEIQYNGGHKVTYGHDQAGRVNFATDPSLGTWTSIYNGFGDLVRTESATGRRAQYTYDVLGRVKTRTDSMPGESETWTYAYDGPDGKGKLAQVAKTSSSDGSAYQRDYNYDDRSRLGSTVITATPAASWGADPTVAWQLYAYDAFGRLTSKAGGLDEKYEYASDGALSAIKATFDGGPFTLWQALDRDAQGRPVHVAYGNGLTTTRAYDPVTDDLDFIMTSGGIQNLSYDFDALGNLRERSDQRNGIVETFGYDRLDRLTWSKINDDPTLYNEYDAFGNLTCKRSTDPVNCNGGSGLLMHYDHATSPHAVTGATLFGTHAYDYDGDGNQLRVDNTLFGNIRDVDYNAFNKPKALRKNDVVTTEYGYGPEQEFLWRRHLDGANAGTVFAPLPGYELHSVAGTDEYRTTVSTPDGAKIVFKTTHPAAPRASANLEYVHTEHLGSSGIVTNGAGQVVEEYAYDAFGWYRDPSTGELVGAEPGIAMTTRTTERGFTGQRQVPDHFLYDYGARLYDPTIGRFLQPDPVLQAPDDMQNLNRYTYVLNNPLKYVDPTGNVARKYWDKLGRIGSIKWGRGSVNRNGWYVPDHTPHIWYNIKNIQDTKSCSTSNTIGCSYEKRVFDTKRPNSAETGSEPIRSSDQGSLVGTTLQEAQPNFNAYLDAVGANEGRSAQWLFLESFGTELSQTYYNDAVDYTSDWNEPMCSTQCQRETLGREKERLGAQLVAAVADNAVWESIAAQTPANFRASVGLGVAGSSNGVRLATRLDLEFGLRNGQLGLRPTGGPSLGATTSLGPGGGSFTVGSRWDGPGVNTRTHALRAPGVAVDVLQGSGCPFLGLCGFRVGPSVSTGFSYSVSYALPK